MPNQLVTLEGEVYWARTEQPEKSPFTEPGEPDKYSWKTMLRPNQESLMKFMDLQSLGIKNKLGKDEQGYYVNFNRPTETRNRKTGKVTKTFTAPVVTGPDGQPFSGMVPNGSKAEVVLDIYEHPVQGGRTSHAARFHALNVKELAKSDAVVEAY
jgi:hypothetical protein